MHLILAVITPITKEDVIYHKRLLEYIKIKKLSGSIKIFYDYQNLREIYNISDVVLLLSTREGMSLVLLESLACGTPVISTPSDASNVILKNISSMLLLPSFDINSAASKINEILSLSNNDRIRLKNKCAQEMKYYTWFETAAKLINLMDRSLFRL